MIFFNRHRREIGSLALQALLVAVVAFGTIAVLVYSVPHLPLANRRTFHAMLRAQMTVDQSDELNNRKKDMLLFLGSSVVERGVAEIYMDSLLRNDGLAQFQTTNSGTGGFFAQANLPMFRAMLERGLKPKLVLYGFFLQELNGRSSVHVNVGDDDTNALKLKPKTLWNVVRYGATALAPLTTADAIHIYLFAANNAFREVHDPTILQRMLFGQNMFERDSTYQLDPNYLRDLRSIAILCKDRNIPFAFYNAPMRPTVESLADLPYEHRAESYGAVLGVARELGLPIWNMDRPGLFVDEDFQDTYHLSPWGARKVTKYLEARTRAWMEGECAQDSVGTLFHPK